MPKFLPLRSARTVAVLAITQIISWGTTFDMVSVLGRPMAPDIGVANEVIFFGLTIMMLTSALAGPMTGRLLVRYGAARLMSVACVLFAAGLLILAAAHQLLPYIVGWLVIGMGGSFGLAAATFTAVVEREGLGGKRVIAILMLFTGLAATIFWPLLTFVNETVGWRWTLVISAGLHLFVCLPLLLFGLPKPLETAESAAAADIEPVQLTASERRRAFVLIAATTSCATFIAFGFGPVLIAFLQQLGASPAAALQLASSRGVFGSFARLMDILLGRRGNALITSLIGSSLLVAGFGIALLLPVSTLTMILLVSLYGFGVGILAVARALLPLSFFSPRDYGLQAARLSLPQNLANAAAPVAFTAILDRLGATAVLATAVILSALSLIFIILLARLVKTANARQTATPSPPGTA